MTRSETIIILIVIGLTLAWIMKASGPSIDLPSSEGRLRHLMQMVKAP